MTIEKREKDEKRKKELLSSNASIQFLLWNLYAFYFWYLEFQHFPLSPKIHIMPHTI